MKLPLANDIRFSGFLEKVTTPVLARKDRLPDFLLPKCCSSKRVLLAAASVLAVVPFAAQAWTLDFSPGSYSVNEADGSLQVGINLASQFGDYGGCFVDGNVVVSGGSATSGSDFNISGGSFSLSNTSNTANVSIGIVNDTVVEGSETISLSLAITSQDCLGSVSAGNPATVTIADDDTAPPPPPSPPPPPPTPPPPTPAPDPIPNLSLDPNFTPNQRSIYDGLLSACNDASGELQQRCQEISNADLDAVIPDQVAAQGAAAVDFAFRQFSIIHGRIVNLRNTQNQNPSLLGYSTININGESIPVGKALMTALGPARGGAAGDDPEAPFRDSPLGFFLKGQFNVGEKDNTLNERGFKTDRKAFTFGVDYSFTDEFVLGAAFGYGSTDTRYTRGNGEMATDAFEFSSYGSYFLPQEFYVDWVMSYALHNFDINRRIQYSGFDDVAKSNVNGDQYGISLGFGKDISLQSLVINPYIRLDYSKTEVDGYQETGGAGLGMTFDKQFIDSATSTIGGQATKAISMPWGILSPGVRFEWVHQYMDDGRFIQAGFNQATAGTGRFSVKTDTPDRDYFNIGSSLALTLPEGRAGFLRYEYRLGQAYIADHTVELGARIPF